VSSSDARTFLRRRGDRDRHLCGLAGLLSYLSYRFPRLRPTLAGEPTVIVQDGKPIERNMRRERLTFDEVMAEAARLQQVSSVQDIAWAVLETSGRISIIPK